jgi:hypothetical protein
MPTIVKPTDQKLCPFLKAVCQGSDCALFLEGARACAITAAAVFAGDICGFAERRG